MEIFILFFLLSLGAWILFKNKKAPIEVTNIQRSTSTNKLNSQNYAAYKEFQDVIIGYMASPTLNDSYFSLESLNNYTKIYHTPDEVPLQPTECVVPVTKLYDPLKKSFLPYSLLGVKGNSNGKFSSEVFYQFLISLYTYVWIDKEYGDTKWKMEMLDSFYKSSPEYSSIKQHIFGNKPISKVWAKWELSKISGIGDKTADLLIENKVYCLGDLIECSDQKLKDFGCNKCIKIKKEMLENGVRG
ncbi:hypothetical protein [Sulfuricurvum sp.]|uniref:hypothetical protein n=1 Tax=Sulfuricurvum sp. TaxID=2025608 RepID=UPI00260AAFBD|nr:hypothetical protein [Sulfuricurvum sp.]MDD2265696.1 hypothetical protein [Sulfuricurvum sp.]MDD2784016.1 hypothetical protein [Sulfuricurvum sp.]